MFNNFNHNDTYWYQLLCRMKSDCDYFLGYGNRNDKALWGMTVKDHIHYMKTLYNSFPDDQKPEWLTWDQILEYEKAMIIN